MTLEERYKRMYSTIRRPPDKPYFATVVFEGISQYESAAHLCYMGAPLGYEFWKLDRKLSRAEVTYVWAGHI